jgi:hypothetical protein
MALNAIAFLGSTPIGAPLLGYLSDSTNPRVALAVGGVATLLAALPLFRLGARQRLAGGDLVGGAQLDVVESSPAPAGPMVPAVGGRSAS